MRTNANKSIINWSDDYQCYVAKGPDLPGCMTHVKTRQQAVKMAEEAIELWIESAKEDGVSVPRPRSFAALA
jgi:predicted RNase H-like HicB family nuclease